VIRSEDDGIVEMSLGVVIVAYHSAATLGRLLESVPGDASVVVVDNASEPETAAISGAHGARYIDPGQNLGYSAAVNRGAALLNQEFLLVLNPDVELCGDPRRAAHALEDSSVLGVVGALESADGRIAGNIHPVVTSRRELWRGVVGWRAYRFDSRRDGDGPVQVDGAWMLFSRDSWVRLCGLDERYELYFEDVALAHRIRELGGRFAVLADVVGRHAGGASAARSDGVAHLLLGVSRVRFYHLSGVTRFPRILGVSTSLLEFASRSIALRPEGFRLRARALRLQLREATRPGSVWLLGPPRPLDRP
jgi:N-acetylglucosaminyl-diphospho-decaprenol L-rhamnosyltransferase